MSAATSLRHSGPTDESSGRRARKALLRDIDRDLEHKARGTLADLRAQLRAARADHQAALKEAVSRCRAHRLAVREKLQAERAQALAELRAKGEAERGEARGVCSIEKGKAEKGTRGALDGARAELAKERAYQEDLKRIARGNRASARTTKRATAAERRSESDDEVRSNLPPELLGLFERVKRSIKAGPRETRTEVFLRYAEEHPREYLQAIDDRTEELVRELERQQREPPRRARNPSAATARKLSAADPRIPCVELGELVAVIYRTATGEHRHDFRRARPRLAHNPSGLVIAGGEYRVEASKIVG